MENNFIYSTDELKHHWQGHRGLTRRVIDAFPEKELFSYSIGGMRPFSEMAMELIRIAEAGMEQMANRNLDPSGQLHTGAKPATKAELLDLWDKVSEKADLLWAKMPPARFRETEKAFGEYEGTVISLMQYFFDNEIHHRGQGYVYLRSLGVEPPPFWDRY
ncbi:damage-inducible protein DinB [Chitinophaga lutea]|uniref:Damage-inducible protein DinB n=1 Tax=Chitinophaga lutea TaxID=2488634 RepID=A0A3N4PJD9_9BACT|nr:DinB family protein [Chitinophaga lutea]RPE08782.1 damage-inducible protein DinB [Chitinophaga lutea]